MNQKVKIHYPFSAITGQEEFKLCLMLCMVDPNIGGVLALGDKGTGKTTTVRGLSQLMKQVVPDFPFVNLPIGATEDRVLGTIQLEALLNDKRIVVHKGLLAQANTGVLYIDEVNLLSDYLMDVLLDAASSGGYYLERDSISDWLDSKFCLVGTMNPEEGELRPQLLDRFGLSVMVKTPVEKNNRKEIMQRRMSYDLDLSLFYQSFEEQERTLANQIKSSRDLLPYVTIDDEQLDTIADTCIQYKVEGLRADILLMKASRAYAALNNRKKVIKEDITTVLPYVMAHRSKSYSSQHNSPKSDDKNSCGEEKEGDTKRMARV